MQQKSSELLTVLQPTNNRPLTKIISGSTGALFFIEDALMERHVFSALHQILVQLKELPAELL